MWWGRESHTDGLKITVITAVTEHYRSLENL